MTYPFNVVVRYNTSEQFIVRNISLFNPLVFSVVKQHSSALSKHCECLCSAIVETVLVYISEVSHVTPLSSLSVVFTLYFLAIGVRKVRKSFKISLNLFSKASRLAVGPTQWVSEFVTRRKKKVAETLKVAPY